MLPQDADMLLSIINMKLRDFYGSLVALCEDLDEDKEHIHKTLSGIGYTYDGKKNQFIAG